MGRRVVNLTTHVAKSIDIPLRHPAMVPSRGFGAMRPRDDLDGCRGILLAAILGTILWAVLIWLVLG